MAVTEAGTLARIIDAFADLEVLVIGEAMLDSYLDGGSSRLCREAPVPIVAVTQRTDAPGAAANTAANVRALGARVRLLSAVGDDGEGQLLQDALKAAGVDTEALVGAPARRTLAKQRVLASGQLIVRFDQGTTTPVGASVESELIDRLESAFDAADAIAISDYGYGVLTPRVLATLGRLQARDPRVIVVDSKHLSSYRDLGVTAVKPNFDEAVRLLGGCGGDGGRADRIAAHGDAILGLTGARMAAITLDSEGAVVVERGRPAYRTYAEPTRHCQAAGAGDTFLSCLALALAAGADAPAAADLASAAAAVVVGKAGTATCSALELRVQTSPADKIGLGRERLAARLQVHREQGRRVVMTSGCFDILHRGHITYLNRSKMLGDVLVVGLNTDVTVRALKGPGRPINSLEDRAQVLAALGCVDYVVAFDEPTPAELIRALRPDVFVKGGDYTVDRLPEATAVRGYGGTVIILPYVEDRSTSGIIERIRAGADVRAA
jgi:D-beta-D-heptose 7-phosphate kinase / D-beta-D-heptose 1-phosphate adenosyltransferase